MAPAEIDHETSAHSLEPVFCWFWRRAGVASRGGGEWNTAKRKGVGRQPPPQGKYVRIGKVGQRKGIQFVKSLQRGIGGNLFCL